MKKQTPFHHKHLELKGKMVDFNGWELPIQYTTITQEHNAVRKNAGLFDISHMGQVVVWGKGAESYLQNLVSNDVKKATIGKGVYAHLLNEMGGVIDDIYVFHLEPERFFVVVNAGTREKDLAWMMKNKEGFEVEIMEAPQAAGLALQGPKAVTIMEILSPEAAALPRNGIGDFNIGGLSTLISRTGYTGEDGFEFFAPAGHLLVIWDRIFQAGKDVGLVPCGLGARDTLRTEVGYPLYGHELDENHTPLEAGLKWVVKLEKENFIGRNALLEAMTRGLVTRLYGLKIESGGVARPGGKVLKGGKEIGAVASGTFAPTLGIPIGTAFLPVNVAVEGESLTVLQGTRELKAITARMPFYKRKN